MGQSLNRRNDWPERMHSAIEEHRYKEFKWGQNDCVLFACNIILAMTDVDLGSEFRATYSTDDEAMLMLRKHWNGTLENLASVFCGPPIEPIALMQRGDVVLIPNNWGGQLGINCGNTIATCGMDGLVFVGVEHVIRAWRIGR
jgi:hypothetical protein